MIQSRIEWTIGENNRSQTRIERTIGENNMFQTRIERTIGENNMFQTRTERTIRENSMFQTRIERTIGENIMFQTGNICSQYTTNLFKNENIHDFTFLFMSYVDEVEIRSSMVHVAITRAYDEYSAERVTNIQPFIAGHFWFGWWTYVIRRMVSHRLGGKRGCPQQNKTGCWGTGERPLGDRIYRHNILMSHICNHTNRENRWCRRLNTPFIRLNTGITWRIETGIVGQL